GINVNAKADDGQTALMYAARFNKNPEVLRALINVGADMKAKDNLFLGKTARDWAVQSNANPEIIKILEGL
ncbi:MAG: ankyrin repeat domain-containing protein, partial [Synergistaceae bacterium]|nr:ankyrin repeat domain-containing protein [Synergistaceae bacterium]